MFILQFYNKKCFCWSDDIRLNFFIMPLIFEWIWGNDSESLIKVIGECHVSKYKFKEIENAYIFLAR